MITARDLSRTDTGAASAPGARRGLAGGRHPLSCHRDLAGMFERPPPHYRGSAAYSGGCPTILEARPRPQPRLPGRIFRPPDRARAASDARQPRRSGIFPRDAVRNRAAAMPHWLAPAANAAGNRRDRPRGRCSVPERLFGRRRSVAYYCSAAYNFLSKTILLPSKYATSRRRRKISRVRHFRYGPYIGRPRPSSFSFRKACSSRRIGIRRQTGPQGARGPSPSRNESRDLRAPSCGLHSPRGPLFPVAHSIHGFRTYHVIREKNV